MYLSEIFSLFTAACEQQADRLRGPWFRRTKRVAHSLPNAAHNNQVRASDGNVRSLLDAHRPALATIGVEK